MMQIVDALGEDGLLRYYGVSYGTALGQIFAAMFPDKVDRMVIDGVLNPHQYVQGLDYQQAADSEAVLDGFLSACQGQPQLCALAARDTSEKNLRQQIDELFDAIAEEPYTYGPNVTQCIDIFTMRSSVFGALYSPILWSDLADWLDAILSRDNARIALRSSVITLPSAPKKPFPELVGVETTTAIRASDTTLRLSNASSVAPIVRKFLAQSRHFGGYIAETQPVFFAQWPFVAKERYTGKFDVHTKNPILVVNNIFDSVTSLDAARNSSATFAGSGLLVQDGYGHTTLAQNSKCTADAVAAYFSQGKLPEAGTVCAVEGPLFVDLDSA